MIWCLPFLKQEEELKSKVNNYLRNLSNLQHTSSKDILDVVEKIENLAINMANNLEENQTIDNSGEELGN